MAAVTHRGVAKGALILGASRVLVFLVPLIATPIFARIFDARAFGAWTVLGSLITLLSAQDFGMCSALRVRLIRRQIAGEGEIARREFYSVFAAILATAIFLSAVILALRPSVRVLGVSGEYSAATYAAAIIGLISVSAAAPFQALYAYLDTQWVALSDVIRALFQILAALIVFVTTRSLFWSLIIFYAPTLVYILLNYEFLRRRRGWRNPFGRSIGTWWIGSENIRKMAIEGLPFLALTILNIALGPLDLLIAGRYLGLTEAGSLGLVLKLVNVGNAFLGAISWGYVGAYGIQFMNQNYAWIKKTIVIQTGIMCIVGMCAIFALVLFGEPIIHIWSGRIVAQRGIYLLAGTVFLSGGINRLLLTVIQGIGRVSRIILPLTICVILKIWGAILLAPHLGANGILLATTATNVVVAGVVVVQLVGLLSRGG